MRIVKLTASSDIVAHIGYLNLHTSFVTCDTETTSLDEHSAKIIDIQLSGRSLDEVVIFSGEHAHLLLLIKKPILFHNFKYDWKVLKRHGVELKGPIIDTMLLSHLADENRLSDSLESWVTELWQDNYKDEFWSKYSSYQDAPTVEREIYACKDIIYTTQLYHYLIQRLSDDDIPTSLIDHVHRLARSLVHTEYDGIKVDLDYLTNKGVEVKSQLDRLLPSLRTLAEAEITLLELLEYEKELAARKTERGKSRVGRPVFDFNSSKQLQELLYGQLKLPVQKHHKTKKPTTDYEALEKIKHLHPIIAGIQKYRDLTKVYSAYIEGTLERLIGGRIYPTFNINGTVSGRISSSNPNMHQLPAEGGIRGIYTPDEGQVFISRDFSSLEVFIEAHLTQDQQLRRVCLEGVSKHDITAQALGVPRSTAKTLNFALQYHCSAIKVAQILGKPRAEGERVYKQYWDTFSGCRDLKAKTDAMVNAGIPIQTSFGRKRRFPKGPHPVWSGYYRQAYSFCVQSPGSDITSKAAYLVDEALRSKGIGRLVMTIHDEILISANKEDATQADEITGNIMRQVSLDSKLTFPLQSVSSGPMLRWED